MIPKSIIHLLSGGLDSVTMLYDLKEQGHSVHCLLFDYRQRHVQELIFAKGHCKRLGVLWTVCELPPLYGLTAESWIVPNRNAILLSHAVNVAAQAKADTVTIGCNQDDADYFPDCRKPFLDALNQTVEAAGYKIEICAPYLDWPKWKIVAKARTLDVPLHEVWSCYIGGPKPCGKCAACQKSSAAFKKEAEMREMRPC